MSLTTLNLENRLVLLRSIHTPCIHPIAHQKFRDALWLAAIAPDFAVGQRIKMKLHTHAQVIKDVAGSFIFMCKLSIAYIS